MKDSEAKELPNGLYKIFWNEGGWSFAAIGRDHYGNVWIAPTNWIGGIGGVGCFGLIERVELLHDEREQREAWQVCMTQEAQGK